MSESYGYNKDCLLKNGAPWFPVMGEMHYSRYKESLWEESLRKMKAGGVSVVSTYVIWIHHEEEEGVFDFTGCRDIGTFVRLCKKVGLSVFLRLGPFVHGEVRNGGFPDWMIRMEKNGKALRSNDETYLKKVEAFWKQVFEQVRGCMEEDGGPVIGVQIENEYGHVGGLRGPAGEAHMRTLTKMAKEIGFKVPLYTATGWGGACIGDLLPVMGGYCEAPWDQRTCEIEPNNNFVFSHTRNDALIACDHHVEEVNSYSEDDFPFLTAELGGGLQVTAHRRPIAQGCDIGAMSTVKLGSGAALLGYYMYHGGSNPQGKLSTLQESKATGYLNDLPEINYDFNAPIRQYGTISDSYKEIKLLAYFLKDFGEDMAVLKSEIPDTRIVPGDMETLRTACKNDGEHGYVFFNNYQRRMHMKPHEDVELVGSCETSNKDVVFPKLTIEEGMYGFFPYRMKLGEAVLSYALATPLCKLNTKEKMTYVFYGNQEPQLTWETDKTADVLCLSREEALNAWKITLDQDYLVLADNYVWEENGKIKIVGESKTQICSYPAFSNPPEGFGKCGQKGRFCVYERIIENEKTKLETEFLQKDADRAVYKLKLFYPDFVQGKKEERMKGHDVFASITYVGEHIEIFADGQKINDHFYTGQAVPISLGYFDFPEELEVVVYVLHEDDKIYIEDRPEFHNGTVCEVTETELTELFCK